MLLGKTLRFWAIFSQALGFCLIILLETWLGRGQAGPWQLRVLLLMLLVALVIAVLRRYQERKQLKRQAEQQAWLREQASDD